MEKKKKIKHGFTLIELLAVIVILAVIALIVTPVVSGIITKARESANARSVEIHAQNVEYEIMQSGKKITAYDGTKTESDLGFTYSDSDKVKCESYEIKDGDVETATGCSEPSWKNTFSYKKGESAKVEGNSKPEEGSGESGGDETPVTKIAATYVAPVSSDTHKGIIYLNPKNLSETCNSGNSTSTTGKKDGCMKWYIYSETSDTYNMILDHNITAEVLLDSNTGEDAFKYVNEALASDTSGWDSSLSPRLITADELAVLTDAVNAIKWTSDKQYSSSATIGTNIGFYFLNGKYGTDSKWQSPVTTTPGTNQFKWLFNYTYNCTSFGCDTADNNVHGYWTSTKVNITIGSTRYWTVAYAGGIDQNQDEMSGVTNGIRPVISVEKNKLQ